MQVHVAVQPARQHDWTAFSSAQSDSETKTRTITALDVSEHRDEGSRIVDVSITAEGFLRYMVRSIVGSLMAAGRGEMDNDLVQRAIEEGERSLVAATAPAGGLTLMSVRYE